MNITASYIDDAVIKTYLGQNNNQMENLYSCTMVVLHMQSQLPTQVELTIASLHRAAKFRLSMHRPFVVFQGKLPGDLHSALRIGADIRPVFEVHHPDMGCAVGLGGEVLGTVLHGAGEGNVVVFNSDVLLFIPL